MPARYGVFSHLTAEKSEFYRSVLSVFSLAKERFRLHLRAAEVAHELTLLEPDVLPAIQQLVQWGNLESIPDTADVATVEEFNRPRFLYQYSIEGDAAERAIRFYEEHLAQPGELQAAALGDILELLRQLERQAADPDAGKVFTLLKSLQERFDDLTARAQLFMGSVQRAIELHSLSVDNLLRYKELLIDYLERFIRELVNATADISEVILRTEHFGVAPLLGACVEREIIDAIDPAAQRDVSAARWQRRWEGLRAWFLGEAGQPSQAEVLRRRALSAIPALLSAIMSAHERRNTRSDRWTDLKTLALWFAQTPDDAAAHTLWRAAFGLSPSRHLYVDDVSLSSRAYGASTSWLAAPSVVVPLRFRETGRHTRRGRQTSVVDRSEEKAALERLSRDEAAQLETARERLAQSGRRLLSQFDVFAPAEFALFLDLLSDALSSQGHAQEEVQVTSSDGRLRIVLEPIAVPSLARLKTTTGYLTGQDCYVTIERIR